MSMYGPESLNEAIRVKGYEYDTVSKKVNKDGEVISKDIKDGERTGTTSVGRGGVLDSVAQHHIEDIDLEKEKAITESGDIITEYAMYIGGQIKRAIQQYGDNSKSQLEKRMVEDYAELQKMGIDSQKIWVLISDEYYGGKLLGNMETEEELQDASKIIKTILKMRINYVNKITSLLSKMLQINYKVLGLSEQQAKIYIDSLTSGKNDAVKSASEVKELIKNNADKFMTNNGEAVDLRPLGFGVILGPTKGYELNFAGTDLSNKDGMLSLIQQAMRYDVVVVAHGGDATKQTEDSKKIIQDINGIIDNYLESEYDKCMDLVDKIADKENVRYTYIVNLFKDYTTNSYYNELFKKKYSNELPSDNLVNEIRESKNDPQVIFNILKGYIKKIEIDKVFDDIYDLKLKDIKSSIKDKEEEDKEFGFELNTEDIGKLKRSLSLREKYENEAKKYFKNTAERYLLDIIQNQIITPLFTKNSKYWYCQPTKTLQAGPFDDINNLVRQLIKEGYRKILIEDCNPGGHKLADDIMNTKGILINYSDFSNYVESFEDNDPNLKIINEAELSLKEFADSYGIDYNDDEYLAECCNWYLENRELIQEGKFDGLKEFFKKILSGIIGFFKRIFDLVKKAFHKLKSLFTGTKDEPKDTKSNFQKPITTKMISVKDKKVVEVTSNNRQELEKAASEMCSTIASEIKKFNQTQQTSMKKIEQDIEKLDYKVASVPKEAASIFENFEMLFEGDLLDAITMIQEFDAGDGSTDNDDNEEEEFSMDDEGGDTPPVEEAPEDDEPQEEDEQEEFSMDEDEGEEAPAPAAETPAATDEPEQQATTDEQPTEGGEEAPEGDEDENFEIPEEGENAEGGEEAPEGDEDEEFSMDGDTEGGEEAPDTGTDDGGETTQEELPESKLRDLEAVVFDDLSEDQKKMKIKELKELYIIIYKKCGTISDMISDIKRDQETVQIIEYISNTLVDLKHYIDDYINDIFDSKTYVENLAQLQKYIMIFNAINKVFEQIKQENA